MLIAHLSDPHVGLDPLTLGGRVHPASALRRALAHVRGLRPAPDVLLLTGDLTDDGREQDYQAIAALLRQELPAPEGGGPLTLAVPGNHDRRAPALRLLAGVMPVAADAPAGLACLRVERGGLHFIGLDSVTPGAAHGGLESGQLDWLARALKACAGEPAVIFMHHPPIITGLAAMDACGLLDGCAELGELVAAHGRVQLIACGHVHRPVVGQLGGALVVAAPSTSHQIDLDLRPGGPLSCRLEPPMIGLYRWTPEEGMVCHFSHVKPFGEPLAL